MEKIFIQSVLFSTAILVVYAFVSPPAELSAESVPMLDTETRVRKGVVDSIDSATDTFAVIFDGISVPIVLTASTTVHSSNGEEAELGFLRDGTGVYVFGRYNSDTHSIDAEKIVMRNRPITERKTLSRAEMKKTVERKGTSSLLKDMNLIVR